jgi:hypothetical protein
MTAKQKPKPDDPKQSQRFVETAHKLGVDETGKSFEKTLRILKPKKTFIRPKK